MSGTNREQDSAVAHELILDGLRALTERVAALDKRLTDHMEGEERIKQEVAEKLGSLAALMHSMPHKDGMPDLHGHRQDHIEMREQEERTRRIRWNLREKLIEWAVIALIVMLASGKFAEFIVPVLTK